MPKNAFVITVTTEETLKSKEAAAIIREILGGSHTTSKGDVNVKKVTLSPVGE